MRCMRTNAAHAHLLSHMTVQMNSMLTSTSGHALFHFGHDGVSGYVARQVNIYFHNGELPESSSHSDGEIYNSQAVTGTCRRPPLNSTAFLVLYDLSNTDTSRNRMNIDSFIFHPSPTWTFRFLLAIRGQDQAERHRQSLLSNQY